LAQHISKWTQAARNRRSKSRFQAAFLLMLTLGSGVLRAASIEPDSEKASLARKQAAMGVELAQHQKYAEAIRAYQTALTLNPKIPGIHLNLGLAYFKSFDFVKAADQFRMVVAQDPTDFRSQVLLGMSYFGSRRYADAASQLERASKMQPGNVQLLYVLAESYLWSGRSEAALPIFRHLLSTSADSAQFHMLLAQALDALDRDQEAIEELELAIRASPDEPNVHLGLGYLFWKAKRNTEAEREFRRDLELAPDDFQALTYLADIELQKEHLDNAQQLLQTVLAKTKTIQRAWLDMGIICARTNRSAEAVDAFTQAIRLEPKRADAHYRLAKLYQSLGRKADAAQEFRLVKELHNKVNEDLLQKISGPPPTALLQ
jgi:tetratricopeptide (TPR) repeat protein